METFSTGKQCKNYGDEFLLRFKGKVRSRKSFSESKLMFFICIVILDHSFALRARSIGKSGFRS